MTGKIRPALSDLGPYPPLSEFEERALLDRAVVEWFESDFMTRFDQNSVPLRGDHLVGLRLRVQYQDTNGEWKNWSEH